MSDDQQNIENSTSNYGAQGAFHGNVNIYYNFGIMVSHLQAKNDYLRQENEKLRAALQDAQSQLANEKREFEAALVNVLRIARDLARDLNIASKRASNSALAYAREGTGHLASVISLLSSHSYAYARACTSNLDCARTRASDLAREIEFSNSPPSIRACALELFGIVHSIGESELGAEHLSVVDFKQRIVEYEERK